jgi:hypothetical protein
MALFEWAVTAFRRAISAWISSSEWVPAWPDAVERREEAANAITNERRIPISSEQLLAVQKNL